MQSLILHGQAGGGGGIGVSILSGPPSQVENNDMIDTIVMLSNVTACSNIAGVGAWLVPGCVPESSAVQVVSSSKE